MKPAIQLSVGFDRCSPHKDGSMGLAFSTQELTNEEKLVLLNHLGKFGWLLFKEDDHAYQEDDIPRNPRIMMMGCRPKRGYEPKYGNTGKIVSRKPTPILKPSTEGK